MALNDLVLMGFAEAYAAIESAWSLRDAGFRVAAFARKGSRPALRRVRGVELHEVSAPEEGIAQTLEDVRALIRSLEPAAFLPLDDGSVWLARALEDDGLTIAGATGSRAELALDKALQVDAAREAGLLVPETTVVADPKALEVDAYPVVVKPARALYEVDGRLARPTGTVVADLQELEQAKEDEWYPPLLVQPLLVGTGEGLFGIVTENGLSALSAHRRVRMLNPQGSASSACESIEVDEELVAPTERFLSAVGWSGLFMVELLRDADGRAWFMELNGRAWGSMALARRRGFEYPAWTVQAALDPSFVPTAPENPPYVLARHLGMELAHLAFVLRGPQSKALTSWPRFWPTLSAMARPSRRNRLYNWRRSEPDVLAVDTWSFVRFFAQRLLRPER
jgi:predicted ATP-grasp superfamily ATP-dependent carboligase